MERRPGSGKCLGLLEESLPVEPVPSVLPMVGELGFVGA